MKSLQIPKEWTFKNKDIASGFDNHVREQLPWYDMATDMVAHIARAYLPNDGVIYDIGASTGNIGVALASTLTARNARLIGVEESEEMAALYKAPGELILSSATQVDYEKFDVAIAFLLFMFLSHSERSILAGKLLRSIKPGGCIIVFDKVTVGGYLGTVMHRLTMANKLNAGVSPKDVLDKELSLNGVQRPLEDKTINNLFPIPVEVFRFGEFCGWVMEHGA